MGTRTRQRVLLGLMYPVPYCLLHWVNWKRTRSSVLVPVRVLLQSSANLDCNDQGGGLAILTAIGDIDRNQSRGRTCNLDDRNLDRNQGGGLALLSLDRNLDSSREGAGTRRAGTIRRNIRS